MLCDFCHKREAVFFIEQVSKNTRKKLNICMECAVSRGISPDPKAIERSIGILFAELANDGKKSEKETDKLCPVCGRSLSLIKKTGRLGCPECYAVFKNDILELMKQKNIKGPYTGSLPHRLSTFRSVLTDRVDLQTKLEKSIESEDYEKAAIYRDYLRALERSPVTGITGILPREKKDTGQNDATCLKDSDDDE
ncbi:MAG: UvrB/UvrC motif-containing protein [Treponema sp.]|jgi:protein arginine kinase activator|nr:UvrB/UvrC motif-containing protein [Treponema sp.]